jgi:hypothetical protein
MGNKFIHFLSCSYSLLVPVYLSFFSKLEGTVKLIADITPNLVKLADLDCTIRNKLPNSYKTRMIQDQDEHPRLRVKELVLPEDSIQLSFEIIRILDLKDEDRNEILGMRSAEERLKAALSLMETVCFVFYSVQLGIS